MERWRRIVRGSLSGESVCPSHQRNPLWKTSPKPLPENCGTQECAFLRGSSALALCRRAAKRQYLAAALALLQIIGPFLHHLRPWLQVERVVVGRADGIARRVGKLQLDVFVVEALLMQDRGGEPTEAMAGHAALVSHALQRLEDGVVAHRLPGVTVAGEEPFALAGERSQGVQHI